MGWSADCCAGVRGCAGPFHVPPVSRSQQQDKAALIAETRRRFEAEYLPGERPVVGGLPALWLPLCSQSPAG